jgi:putative ABC transport system permease protein
VNELFGVPIGTFLIVVLAMVCVAAGGIGVLALRNRILVRLGVRNLRRRPARTALIVVGLMLGTTIISAALTTGDTMNHTIRQTATSALGETDVVVSAKGAVTDIPGELGAATGTGYFDEAAAQKVETAARDSGLADAVVPAIIEEVAVQAPRSGQTEPSVNLFASDPAKQAALGRIESTRGGSRSLADLSARSVFLNRKAAKELGVDPGEQVRVFGPAGPELMRVADVVDFKGAGTADAALLMPLRDAQQWLDKAGLVKFVLISNRGSGDTAVARSDAIRAALAPVEGPLGLEATATKQDAIDTANEAGTAFMAFFTTFGSFSIAAGILLIFLIFVMLAAERRAELGIARAIGTRRGHLVEMFVFEGLAYDVAAAFAGALLGAGVAYGMVIAMSNAFGASDADAGLQIQYAVSMRSLVIAMALGVLLTLIVVAVSAFRVSVMTISTAIRNLSDPPSPHRRRRRLVTGGLGVVLGVLMAMGGASGDAATPLISGVSIVLIGLVPLLRAIGAPDRATYSTVGLLIVVLWMLPWSLWEDVFGPLAMNFSTWITAGFMVVLGAVWLIVYNADLMLGAAMRSIGRLRSLTPVLRMSMAYPLASRFRTGTTLAMFTLVVFTLVTGTATSSSFIHALQDLDKSGGGYDVRAGTGPIAPITDLRAAIDNASGLRASDITAVGSQSVLAVDAKQNGTSRGYESYAARGLDTPFLAHTTFGLGAIARGYGSSREVWNAMATTPGLAVVDSFIVPHRSNFNFGAPPSDFRLSGFVYDDGVFAPIPIEVRDPQTGRTVKLTVVGVLSDSAPLEMLGVSTSQHTLAGAFPGRVAPTIHYLETAPNVDPGAVARQLESAFVANGMNAESIATVVEDATAASVLFNRLIQGFMGLGLIVGVAALGVISARAVAERRQMIGVLRAIGFRRRMVQAAFLLESSFVAVTAIVVGAGLGLLLAYEIIRDQRRQPSWEGLSLSVPWLNLTVIFVVVLAVALIATLAPARRASRVLPAEALRYQ